MLESWLQCFGRLSCKISCKAVDRKSWYETSYQTSTLQSFIHLFWMPNLDAICSNCFQWPENPSQIFKEGCTRIPERKIYKMMHRLSKEKGSRRSVSCSKWVLQMLLRPWWSSYLWEEIWTILSVSEILYMCNYVSVYRYYRYLSIIYSHYTPRVHAQEACFHTYERLRFLSRWAHLRFEKKHPQCLDQNPPRHEKRIARLGRETTKYIAKNY